MASTLRGLKPCEVCGSLSVGRRCQVFSCVACCSFFRRCITNNRMYSCITGRNDCAMNHNGRNGCRACRFKRCLDAGMDPNTFKRARVEKERLVKKLAAASHLKPQISTSLCDVAHSYPLPLPPSVLQGIPDDQFRSDEVFFYSMEFRELPMQLSSQRIEDYNFGVNLGANRSEGLNFFRRLVANIVVVCVRRARRNCTFSALPRPDQCVILTEVWAELFLLAAAYWPIDPVNIAMRIVSDAQAFLPKEVVLAIAECRKLKLDVHEYKLMEVIILARKDCSEALFASSEVKSLCNRSQIDLQQYMTAMRLESIECFGHALLVLRNLRAFPSSYFLDLVGFSIGALAHLLEDASGN